MNVSTGGSHILLFERDQQLGALLAREFQLAGYQSHVARTAVEVFDGIGRYPVRLLLLNLGVPTVGRREFWVALGAQGKGREVQTFTYRCTNLAGYGPVDLDEQELSIIADMEVDGMGGVKNLVEAVRMRIARLSTDPLSPAAAAADGQTLGRAKGDVPPIAIPPSPASIQQLPTGPAYSALTALASSTTPPPQQPPIELPDSPISTYTDRIRAVIYPRQGPSNTPVSGPLLPPVSTPSNSSDIRAQPVLYSGQETGITPVPATADSADAAGQPGYYGGKLRMVNLVGSSSAAQPLSSERGEVANRGRLPQNQYPSNQGNLAQEMKERAQRSKQDMPNTGTVNPQMALEQSRQFVKGPADAQGESDTPGSLFEQVQASMQGVLRRRDAEAGAVSENPILDIMQHLPPMSSPVPQPSPTLPDERTARSLGSVLLEGRLVPQNRLEVAHSVQRMLRGVDLNYQLGEILLMFKLLTPDQLLAASLVSAGLISTVQISALGRIRQELHAIGLEYDLEGLLILFRLLTPEQLREVRAGW